VEEQIHQRNWHFAVALVEKLRRVRAKIINDEGLFFSLVLDSLYSVNAQQTGYGELLNPELISLLISIFF